MLIKDAFENMAATSRTYARMELHEATIASRPKQSKSCRSKERFRVRGAWRGGYSRKQLGDLTEKAKSSRRVALIS